MTFNPRIITTSVGYSFAIAALCSLAIVPQAALADGESNDEADSNSPASASTGKRVYGAPVASEKSETVYLFANPDGSVKNIEVSETLKNPLGEDEIADSSILTGIVSVEDDATFAGSGDNMVWNAAGKDLSYTGVTTKKAPVSVRVSFFLDGKTIPYEKLAGATGKLKIRYDYDNSATTTATINGKKETLYVPFTFITALLFDNSQFKNAHVVNGKIIDDGDRTIIAGYAIPGLKKSLGKLVEDFDIPEYFELTADVEDFELQTSLTIATAGLLEDFDTSDLDTDELEDASSELASAMDKILSGTGDLKKGLDKLAAGAKSASVASGKLASGAKKLAKGADKLSGGIDAMKESTADLPEGVKALADGSSSLATALPDAVSGSGTLLTGADVLNEGLKALEKGLQKAVDGIGDASTEGTLIYGANSIKSGLEVLKSGDGTAENAGLVGAKAGSEKLAGLLSNSRDALLSESDGLPVASNALGAAEANNPTSEIESALDKAKALPDGTDGKQDIIEALEKAKENVADVEGYITDAKKIVDGSVTAIGSTESGLPAAISGASQITSGLGAAIDGIGDETADGTLIYAANAVEGGLDFLKNGDGTDENPGLAGAISALGSESIENTLIYGLHAIRSGLSSLNTSLSSASTGAKQLASGLDELNDNVPTLVDGIDSISEGASQLANGSSNLSEGLDQYDDGMESLESGATSAAKGAGSLKDGLQAFNDEGISEISDLIDEDILPFKIRLEAISNAAKQYNNFAGITEGTSGNVKFVIETDPITFER